MWAANGVYRGLVASRVALTSASPLVLSAAVPQLGSVLAQVAAPRAAAMSSASTPLRAFSTVSPKKLKLADTMFRARQRTSRISSPASAAAASATAVGGHAAAARAAAQAKAAAEASRGPPPPNVDFSNPAGITPDQLRQMQDYARANPDKLTKPPAKVTLPKRRAVTLPNLAARGPPARSLRGLVDVDTGMSLGFGPGASPEKTRQMAERILGKEAAAELAASEGAEVFAAPEDVTLESYMRDEMPYITEDGTFVDPGAEDDRGLSMRESPIDTPDRVELPTRPLPPPHQLPPPPLTPAMAAARPKYNVLMGDVPFPEELPGQPYALRVCVLGTPNSGKSVLVNNITRAHITAVSQKRNTTRRAILGVLTEANTQVTLYDTPGINEIKEAKQYQRELATEAWDAVADADMALVVIDAAKRLSGPELFMLHKVNELSQANPALRLILVLNKVDLVDPKGKLLDLLQRISPLAPFTDCFMISALTGDGVADVENYLFNNAVAREWEHDSEATTDLTEQEVAMELVREVLFQRLNQEIPYAVEQEVAEWQVLRNGSLRVDFKLTVRRQAHRVVLLGTDHATLNGMIQQAEFKLRNQFKRPVHVYFRINVNESQSH
jgi:GTP-binding protein Era